MIVASVRDLKRQPLDPETGQINPTLNRGRYLVTGEDLDKGAERSFYLNSMVDIVETSPEEPLRNGGYCVVEQRRVTFSTAEPGEAIAFMIGRRRGVLCSVVRSHRK